MEVEKKWKKGKSKLRETNLKKKINKMLIPDKIESAPKELTVEEFLDSKVEEIEEMLFRLDSITKIAKTFSVTEYRFWKWTKATKHSESIAKALEFSSEMHMMRSRDILQKWIDDPTLTMAQTSLIRELSILDSRMAGFRNPKIFGKKVEEEDKTPKVITLSNDQFKELLGKMDEMVEDKKEIESSFDEFEEVRDVNDANEDDINTSEDKDKEKDGEFEEFDLNNF